MADITAVCGPMWAGKSNYLKIARERARLARRSVLCIKPLRDTRTKGKIATNELRADGSVELCPQFDAVDIEGPEHLAHVFAQNHFQTLIADECQFYPGGVLSTRERPSVYGWFTEAIHKLRIDRRSENTQIIVAGLDMDFEGKAFGAMPELMAIADTVIKLTGVCMHCGSPDGRFSYRKSSAREQIVVGHRETYEVRCLSCWYEKK